MRFSFRKKAVACWSVLIVIAAGFLLRSSWPLYVSIRGFSFEKPADFFFQQEIDGTEAYSRYYTSKDIHKDFRQLGKDDAQLAIIVSKKQDSGYDELNELMNNSFARIISSEPVVISGVAGTQRLEDFSQQGLAEPGCQLVTYFLVKSRIYTISLFSPGSCDTVKRFRQKYDSVIRTFRY